MPTGARKLTATPRFLDKKILILLPRRKTTVVTYMSTVACDSMQKEKYASVSFHSHTHPGKRYLRVYCNWYSAGGIVTKVRPGQPRNFVSIPSRGKSLLFQKAQTDNGAKFAPCLKCTD
jgi:hypothetical protein